MNASMVFGTGVLPALGLMAVIGGLLSAKTWGDRLVSMMIAFVMLMMSWLMVGGVLYILVNVATDVWRELGDDPVTVPARILATKGLTFALLLFLYGRHIVDEWRSGASGPRLGVGGVKIGGYPLR
ncbi:MAG: hypothetical protein H7A52_17720 [Akkermansiaceae bacterium]|nr:hypothetical protein [Akkermansiaceae bacterium]